MTYYYVTDCGNLLWKAFDSVMLHRNTEECVPSQYGSMLTLPLPSPLSSGYSVVLFQQIEQDYRDMGSLMIQSLKTACEYFVILARHLLLYHWGHAVVRACRCLIALQLHDMTGHWQHNIQGQAGDRILGAAFTSLCDQTSLRHSLEYVAMST